MMHHSHASAMRRSAGALAVLAIGLAALSALPPLTASRGLSGYVPLHLFLETGSIVIAMLIFAIGWNAYSRARPGNVTLLACVFLGVALLDFSHTLSFKGMPDFVTPSDPEKAINFWLTARLLAALGLLVAVLTPWRPFAAARTRYLLLGLTLLVVALANWLFLVHPGAMPRTFIAGEGLTPFKIYAEYFIIGLGLAAAAALWLRMRQLQPFNAAALFGAIGAMVLSEFCFTRYSDVTDLYNLFGHLYKSVSYLFLYRAIFVETVELPYRRLFAAKSQLRATQQAIPDLLWLKDPDGVYLDCNARFEALVGRRAAEVIGKTDYDLVEREQADSFRAHDRAAIAADRPSMNEEWLTFADSGERRLVETVKTPLRDARGELIGVLGLARDITERKTLERQLQEINQSLEGRVRERTADLQKSNAQLAEALAHIRMAQDELVQAGKLGALGSMVAGIAHELNTPIGNTLMTASALREQTDDFVTGYHQNGLRRSSFERYLDNTRLAAELIMKNLERAAELIRSFKQVAVDQQSSVRRDFRLRELCGEIALALGPFLRKSKVQVGLEVPDGIALDSYPGALGQVLISLINNAVVHAFDEAGGEVKIRASQSEPGWVEIRVEDSGRGIPAEHLGRVFDPFFTTRFGKGGSGLGLSIVYNLVTQVLHGKITVESEPGSGARFILIVPLAPVAALS